MGKKEQQLALILGNQPVTLPAPKSQNILNSQYASQVQSMYIALGGVLNEFPLNLRAWDIQYNNWAIELDEQLHFNRFRELTLSSVMYSKLPGFPLQAYRTYCKDKEQHCIKAGCRDGTWTNPSCERQFGVASPPGVFVGNGSPRWKQRAFYDFVKDLSYLTIGVRVIRIAIWDTICIDNVEHTIEESLTLPISKIYDPIVRLIHQQAMLTL